MKSPETVKMEERFRELRRKVYTYPNARINQLMDLQFIDCSAEEKTLTLGFDVEWWMMNPFDTMHGGMICTAFDMTFGSLAIVLSDKTWTPTIQLAVSFIRPIGPGAHLRVKVHAASIGKTVSNLTGEVTKAGSDTVYATATAVFFMAK
ncbi:MAG: PaaI family thioesterase [Oscillospiraceae bacterium]